MTALKSSLYPSKLAKYIIQLLDREQALMDNVMLQCKGLWRAMVMQF